MFGKKKLLMNDIFGEMIYSKYEWTATKKIPITLWNETFYVTPTACTARFYGSELATAALKKRAGINEVQEKVFCYFKENMSEELKQIEKRVEEYYETADPHALISKFVPNKLFVDRNGDIGLVADNTNPDEAVYFWI
jgi:hypothetical protein